MKLPFYDNSDLNIIIENFPNLVYWKDKNFIYQGCNKNFADILGYKTPSEIIGKSDNDLAHEFKWSEEKIKKLFENDKLIIEKGIDVFEEDFIPINNSIKIYLTSKKPLYKNNELIGILGISTDITDRKKMEEELKEAKEKNEIYLHGIVENLPQLVYWKDKNLIYQGCNNLCAQVLNLKNPAEIVGKSDNDFGWTQQRIEELHDVDRMILKNGSSHVVEDIIPIKNTKRIFLTSKTPLIDKNGNFIGILGISTDVSDLKKMEKKLIKAKIAAEAGEKAKTEFIANISHDMRTPLSGIISVAHDLEEDTIAEAERKELSSQLAESGDVLLEMFEEILEDVAAEHMTEHDVRLETFDINRLVDKLVKLEKPSLTQKGLKFLTHIDPNIPQYLVSDRRKIHRIILNLIGNAVKFTKQGHIALKIERLEQANDHTAVTLKFHVMDTGIGVSEDAQKHLFERFYKARPSYQTEYKGFGLGLHIAKAYTHLLGGTIGFDSQEAVGSDFSATITLKIASEDEIAAYNKKLAEKPSALKVKTMQSTAKGIENIAATPAKSPDTQSIPDAPHVLIIEDNLILRRSMVRLLKKFHLNITDVEDGKPALERAKKEHFDLILSDVGLIEMSGIEFTQQLRAFEKENNKLPVPIVGVTAHAVDSRDECLDAGMNAVTAKPLAKHTLQDIFKQFLPDYQFADNA